MEHGTKHLKGIFFSSPLPIFVDQLRNRGVCLVHQLATRVEDVRDARVEGLPGFGQLENYECLN